MAGGYLALLESDTDDLCDVPDSAFKRQQPIEDHSTASVPSTEVPVLEGEEYSALSHPEAPL